MRIVGLKTVGAGGEGKRQREPKPNTPDLDGRGAPQGELIAVLHHVFDVLRIYVKMVVIGRFLTIGTQRQY